ncbi:MAG TPA: Bax inhibitor-1/YccA family protein [Herpetosiphonaceae bacterium]
MYAVPAITQSEMRQRSLLQQVYAWMAGGLTITGLTAMYAFSSGFIERLLRNGSGVMIGLMVAELALVLGLTFGLNRMSAAVASGAFVLYSVLNGVTLSVIFLVYTQASIASTFLITAGMFAGISLYGYTTKRDLSTMGSFLTMALLGLVLASIVNFFLKSTVIYWITTYAGVLIFTGLTAYDTQKIKRMSQVSDGSNTTVMRRLVIMGALTLYLDFINMFLYLLRIFGRRD